MYLRHLSILILCCLGPFLSHEAWGDSEYIMDKDILYRNGDDLTDYMK